MERGAPFSRIARLAKSSSGLNLVQANQPNKTTPISNTTGNNGDAGGSNNGDGNMIPLPCMVREQDHYMPIANVIRLMRRILPPNAKISDDSKETMQECVSEFISFVTGEANERCRHEQRKTINADDVIWALGKLGFDNYVEPLTLYLARYRESENDKTSLGDLNSKRSLDFGPLSMGPPLPIAPLPMAPPLSIGPLPMAPSPMGPLPMAPLPMGSLPLGPYGPPFQMGPQQGIFDPTAMTLMSGYYKDESGTAAGSSSEAAMTEYDPFAPFK